LMRCRMLMEQTGGKLWAEEHEGGALFKAQLPIWDHSVAHREEPEIISGSGYVGVDMSAERKNVFVSMLRAMGYTPVEATDARSRLVLLDETTAREDLVDKLQDRCPVLVLCRSDSVIKADSSRVMLLPRPCTMAELSIRIAAFLTEKTI